MNAKFKKAFDKTSQHEGGYAANKNGLDRGGETYRGIARNYHPTWKGWPIIDAAKDAGKSPNSIKSESLDNLVANFYTEQFWNVLCLDQLESQAVADEIFDTAVNMGIPRAVRFLQESLNIIGEKLTVDGDIGPRTLAAANRANETILVRLLNILQGSRYIEIVRADKSQRAFLNAWLGRTIAKP